MSDNIIGPAFWSRVDGIINLANTQCDTSDPTEVGASTLFASARFNTFLFAKGMGSAANMTAERERALEYFTGQFREMMTANFDDFIKNFDAYMLPDPQ